MKKGYFLLLFSFLFCSFSYSQYVTLEGRQFKDENGNDFYPVVCNFSTEYLYTSSPPQPVPFFPSPSKDHDGHCYECNSLPSCLEQFSSNFKKIKDLNFNTIRLYMLNPGFYNGQTDSTHGWAIKALDLDFLDSVNCYTSFSKNYYTKPFYLDSSFRMDTLLSLIFQFYDSVILRASRESLKVLLNVGIADGKYSSYFVENYPNYLSLVGQHFSSVNTPDSIRKAILAYVILEEPCFSWDVSTMWPTADSGHSKQDVCHNISKWYDTLKSNDPNHLITIGFTPFDLFEFDPGVMKIDFASPHIYPQKRFYERDNFFQGMVDQAHGWFYYLAKVLPMPYLLGETGFRSKYMDDDHPANQGTNAQQKLFADSTIKNVEDCYGSGYSWWYYQDYYWGNTSEGFWGLYGRNVNTFETEEKPVVDAFKNYTPYSQPGVFSAPNSYFDPYHHSNYAPDTNIITGHVQDLNGKPIKNAYIRGQTRLFGVGNDARFDTQYTFTNDSGNFVLRPFDYEPDKDPNYNVIETLYITAPGCSRYYSEVWGPPGVNDDLIYILDGSPLSYADTITSILIQQSEKRLFQSWNDLYLNDSVFIYGDGEFTARVQVSITTEFHAYSGSEVWVHNSYVFPICDGVPSDNTEIKSYTTGGITRDLGSSLGDITIDFLISEKDCRLMIYPNPSSGVLNVNIQKECLQEPIKISIFDQMTRQILEVPMSSNPQQVDLSEVRQGIYYLILSDKSDSYTRKIVIM